jgi:hypothetical protein
MDMMVPWTKMGESSFSTTPHLYCFDRTDISLSYRHEMESDDIRLPPSQKRSLSLTPEIEHTLAATIPQALGKRARGPSHTEARPQTVRGPVAKRSKFTYDTVLESHVKETMDAANPLGRRAVKQKAKKERKAAARASRAHGDGMVVDNIGEAKD